LQLIKHLVTTRSVAALDKPKKKFNT